MGPTWLALVFPAEAERVTALGRRELCHRRRSEDDEEQEGHHGWVESALEKAPLTQQEEADRGRAERAYRQDRDGGILTRGDQRIGEHVRSVNRSVAVRDQDIAAEIIGINTYRYKLLAFAISSFYAGVTGVLYTYYFGIANYEAFQLPISIDYLAMCIIGGLGSVMGSVYGAVFVTLLPVAIRLFMETVGVFFVDGVYLAQVIAQMRLILFGSLIIFFLVVEPEGLNKLWLNIRSYFRVWPFSY